MKAITSNRTIREIGRFLRAATYLPALIAAFAIPAATTQAATNMVIFQENFDNTPPYNDDSNIPVGYSQIHYGYWNTNTGVGSTITTVTNRSLSATRSVEIHRGTNNAVLIGYFGTNNTGVITTTESIQFTAAFQLTSLNTTAEVWIRATDSKVLGYVQLRSFTSTAYARGLFANSYSTNTISLDLNTWYYLDLLMPADPSTSSQYTYSIYQNDGTTYVGGETGFLFATNFSGTTNYRYFTLQTTTDNASINFDNISVQTVPEPTTLGLLGAVGAVALLILRRRRKHDA